jgi:hypothetical protein
MNLRCELAMGSTALKNDTKHDSPCLHTANRSGERARTGEASTTLLGEMEYSFTPLLLKFPNLLLCVHFVLFTRVMEEQIHWELFAP